MVIYCCYDSIIASTGVPCMTLLTRLVTVTPAGRGSSFHRGKGYPHSTCCGLTFGRPVRPIAWSAERTGWDFRVNYLKKILAEELRHWMPDQPDVPV